MVTEGRKLASHGAPLLGEDLMMEILASLPVKSLLRFRCVCKTWLKLISSSYFVQMHLRYSSTRNAQILICRRPERSLTSFLSFHDYESLHDVSSQHLQIPGFNWFHIISSGGLLCIWNTEKIVLCNPVLRQFKLLPPYPVHSAYSDRFHPCVLSIGLGFNSDKSDFKVIAFILLSDELGKLYFEAKLYNLSTNSWREMGDGNFQNILAHGTLFKGFLHWAARRDEIDFVLAFDMSNEVFRDIQLPYIDREERKAKRLTVCDGCLTMLSYSNSLVPPELKSIDVWVMQQYGVAESWTKKFIVGPVPLLETPFLVWKHEAILAEWIEAEWIEEAGQSKEEGRLVSCAIATSEANDFNIASVPRSLEVMDYHESLVSLNGDDVIEILKQVAK